MREKQILGPKDPLPLGHLSVKRKHFFLISNLAR